MTFVLMNNYCQLHELQSKVILFCISITIGEQGAPTQIVSQLMLQAYVDNYDYFYQVHLH